MLKNFDIVSASQGSIVAGFQFEFPVVGTTGRTAVQATAADNVHVHGSAVNFTLSHDSQPFTSQKSGLAYLHKAEFDGNADAVGIDVDGRIGKLIFKKGLGNPHGVATGSTSSGQTLPATTYGVPEGTSGYPASGDLGGLVSATSIGSLVVGPANTLATTSQNVLYVQVDEPGFVTYATTPGYSLTNAIVATSGSINQVNVVGPLLNTEIKTGFDYPSFVQGQEGTRAGSKIKHLNVNGDLISSDISATVRPVNNHYNRSTNLNGNGSIRGPSRARRSTPAARPAWATPARASSPNTSRGDCLPLTDPVVISRVGHGHWLMNLVSAFYSNEPAIDRPERRQNGQGRVRGPMSFR